MSDMKVARITELSKLCFNHPDLVLLAFTNTLEMCQHIGLIFKGNKHLQDPLPLVTAAALKINLI